MPEPQRAIGIVGWEFDEGRGHRRKYGWRFVLALLRARPGADYWALFVQMEHWRLWCGTIDGMPSELDQLRRRSEELGLGTSSEAIATNREIL